MSKEGVGSQAGESGSSWRTVRRIDLEPERARWERLGSTGEGLRE